MLDNQTRNCVKVMKRRIPYILALLVLATIGWSAAGPAEWRVWWMACAWEIIEWLVAVWDGGDDGLAFLGSQGDIWDAQEDMLADTLGAILAALLFVGKNRR